MIELSRVDEEDRGERRKDDGIQVRLGVDGMVVDFVNWNYIDLKLSIELLNFEIISSEGNF